VCVCVVVCIRSIATTNLFTHENELWVPLMEKAYAKLHRCYEAIESGSIAPGLMDLTGEAAETLKLTTTYESWEKLLEFTKEKYLTGCACIVNQTGPEPDTGMGILGNHAYSLIEAVLVKGGHKLLRIRNPW